MMSNQNPKDSFLSVENMKVCLSVFHKYMLDTYDFDIYKDAKKTSNIRKLIYDIMVDINNQYYHSNNTSMKDMNNITLNYARDYFKENYRLTKANKVNMRSLDRDQDAYGPRILITDQLKPTPTFRKSVDDEYKSVEDARRQEVEKRTPQTFEEIAGKSINDTAFDPDEFMKRVNELEQKRDLPPIQDLSEISQTRFQQDIQQPNALENMDPKAFYQMTQNVNSQDSANADVSQTITLRQELVPPPSAKTMLISKYLSVNGFDRNWLVDKNRFNFRVDFSYGTNSMQERYRNIKSIQVSRVIIPMEIDEVQSITNIPKSFYNYGFSFSFPYIMLNISEFGDIYDGTNDAVRRCFSKLIFDKCYKAPNGRGYLILQPMQSEKKIFYPAPLSSLSKLSISLTRPNGQLFNHSKDEYRIFKIEHDMINRHLLKVVTDKYFDKNEFYKGDTILMKNFELKQIPIQVTNANNWMTIRNTITNSNSMITIPSGSYNNPQDIAVALTSASSNQFNTIYNEQNRGFTFTFVQPHEIGWSSNSPLWSVLGFTNSNSLGSVITSSQPINVLKDTYIRDLNGFINKNEGHEILEMGQPNDTGFYRNFYIHAPGEFDINCGKYIPDSNLIGDLNIYNNNIDWNSQSNMNGDVLNTSLQCILSFSLEQVIADPGSIELNIE